MEIASLMTAFMDAMESAFLTSTEMVYVTQMKYLVAQMQGHATLMSWPQTKTIHVSMYRAPAARRCRHAILIKRRRSKTTPAFFLGKSVTT